MNFQIDLRTESNLPLLRSFCLISRESAAQILETEKRTQQRGNAMAIIARRDEQLRLIDAEIKRRERLNSGNMSLLRKVITKCEPDPRIAGSGALFLTPKKVTLRKPIKPMRKATAKKARA